MTTEMIRKAYEEINTLIASGTAVNFDKALDMESDLMIDVLAEISIRDDCGAAKVLAQEVINGREQLYDITADIEDLK